MGPEQDRASVLATHAENAAIAALRDGAPDAVAAAKFDRDELTLTIVRESIVPAARLVRDAGFNFLEDVTCVDLAPDEPRFRVVYHILSHSMKQRVRLVVLADSVDPVVDSITSIWPSANFYEREIFDLFGVRFGGHPDLRRIMMPEEWEGHPLRKDYPVEGYR
jgi:NADH-quinone oxidoreductase subunit C